LASRQFAVIGLGRFGTSLALTLSDQGHDVLCIDVDETKVQDIADMVTHAVQADSTNEEAMRQLGITNFDTVVVAIGQDIHRSILTTLILKELGVNRVVAKAQTELHGKVLAKIGADKVVYPERDMGVKVAESLTADNIVDVIELSAEYRIAEVVVPEQMQGKSLLQLNLRQRYHVNVIAIRRGDKTNIAPMADEVLEQGDLLAVIGRYEDIQRLSRL